MNEETFLRLEFSFNYSNLDEEREGITKYMIDIFRIDDGEFCPLIGKMKAHKFEIDKIEEIIFALDLERETVPYMELFNSNSFLNKVLNTAESPTPYENLLILDRLEILPEFRGFGYGKLILELIERTIGFSCITVMIPFPLQFEGEGKPHEIFGKDWSRKMCLQELHKNYEESNQKLVKYYQSCGFRKVPRCSEKIYVRGKI